MRKNWLLLFVLSFAATAAMGQSPLDDRVSLNAKTQPLKQVLYSMIDQGARLSFSNSILPSEKMISITAENERVGDVLPIILAGTDLSIELVGAQIVIVRKVPPQPAKQQYTVSGYVVDVETGERIINATIFEEKKRTGTYSNEFGYFSMSLPEGPIELMVSSLGYEGDTINFTLKSKRKLDIALRPWILSEVVVAYFNDSTLLQTRAGELELNLEQANKLPSLAGETDILRLAYTLPGIQTGADGFGGISVRGGDIDQNLFLLDGVPVYNATHGLGLYSIYNTAAVRSAKIMKGNFPAQYGGRVSSIWDIQTKEGNTKKVQGELELGIGSVQVAVEGPLRKGKGSWFISGRRSLLDFLSVPISKRLREEDGKNGYLKYHFSDLNAKANYSLSPKDRLYLSIYKGKDNFLNTISQDRWFTDTLSVVANEEVINWGNNITSMRWNHLISENIFANVTATYSNYFYNSEELVDLDLYKGDTRITRDAFFQKYQSSINDFGLKTDFDFTAYSNHRFRFGLGYTQHKFQPGIVRFEEVSIFDEEIRDTIGAFLKNPLISTEYDVYVQDEMKIGRHVNANIGMRGSALSVKGKWFFVPQPRLIFNVFEGQRVSYNLSVTHNSQFLHLLSPTNIGLPKDLWVSATKDAPPQRAWQFTTGTQYKPKSWLSVDLEAYYKLLSNVIYYQGGTLEAVNATNWQDDVALGKGWAYGAELLVKVTRGNMGGWASYTYGHSDRQFEQTDNPGPIVNNGNRYPIRLDRRHNFNLQYLYKMSHSWEFSAGFTYGTGTAFTFPSVQFEVEQPIGGAPTEINTINVITELNPFRMKPYHRLDFSFNHNFNIRSINHILKLGVYNAYFRKNPVYYYLRDSFDEVGKLNREVVQVSLLRIFPTLRYIMEFK